MKKGKAEPSRAEQIEAARRRARLGKAAVASFGAAVFGMGAILARQSYPGHPKSPTTPLTAPPRFVSIVRQNLLQAGIVAPPQAPPGATTGVS